MLLAAVLIGLAFIPAVQTWAVRRATAGQPGGKLDIGGVAIGMQHIHVENIRIEQPGWTLTLPSADVTVPVLGAVQGQVQIGRVTAKGWTIDLSKPGPVPPLHGSAPVAGPTAKVQTAFAGIFQYLKLPVDLALEIAELEGDVVLPQGRAHFVLSGGQLGAGKDSEIIVQGELRLNDPQAAVSLLTVHASVKGRMDTPSSFERVGVTVDAVATGRQFPNGTPAQVSLDTTRDAQGETYTAVLLTGKKELGRFAMRLPAGGAMLSGTWAVNATDQDVAPFVLGHTLPRFTAAGQGTFATDASFQEFNLAGQLAATAGNLGVLAAELNDLGEVNLKTDFDVRQSGDLTRVTRLGLHLDGAKPIAAVEALQGFEINRRTGELKVPNPGSDLLQLTVTGMPLGWAQPFLTGVKIAGGQVSGAVAASANDGGFRLRFVALELGGTLLKPDGQIIWQGATEPFAGTGSFSAQDRSWQVTLPSITVIPPNEQGRKVDPTPLVLANFRAGQAVGSGQPIKLEGGYLLSLGSIRSFSPAATEAFPLLTGGADGNFSAELGDKLQIKAKVGLSKLMATATQLPLADVGAEAQLNIAADGGIVLSLPVVVTQEGRRSELTLTGDVGAVKAGVRMLDLQLAGETLYLADLMPFADLGGEKSQVGTPDGPARAPVDAGGQTRSNISLGPPWAGLGGTVKFTVKKVVFSPAWQSNLSGTLTLAAGLVTLETHGGLGADAPFSLKGNLTHTAGGKEPYALEADASLANFDLSALQQQTVEGRANFEAHLTSQATVLEQLGTNWRGKIQLLSKGGLTHLLAVTDDKSGVVRSTASAGAAILGTVVGQVVGGNSGGNVARAITRISDLLHEIRFDQLKLTVSRDAAQDLVLEEFALISPEVRLDGHGRIRHSDGKELFDQPLALQLQVGAQGSLGSMMQGVSLLSPTPDSLGYLPLAVELPELGGTLRAPDTAAFYRTLAQRAASKGVDNATKGVLKGASGLLNGLFGK